MILFFDSTYWTYELTAVIAVIIIALLVIKHKHVIEAINNKIQSAENSADYQKMFATGTYKDSQGRTYPMYYFFN